MQVIDANGQSRDSGWLYSVFGPVDIRSAPTGSAYRVVELREVVGPATIVVTVLDANGQPVPNVPVVWSWPDAPVDASLGWDGKGVVGPTNANGDVGFGMGKGAYYFPPTKGPHSVFMTAGDYVGGLGMIGLTNHRHIDVVYQYVPVAPPEPQPEPNPYEPKALGVTVLDSDGNEQDADWLRSQYGRVELHSVALGYQVTRLWETHGGPFVALVVDEFGAPLDEITVSFRHREGTGGGGTAQTDVNGRASFTLSNVHKYSVPAEFGPFLATVRNANSDAVIGLGQVRNTDRHLNVLFEWQAFEDEDPDDEPQLLSEKLSALAEVMAAALELIEDIREELEAE